MDLTVCHKQIEEKWRQQIIVVAEHEFSSIEGIDLEDEEEQYVLDSLSL